MGLVKVNAAVLAGAAFLVVTGCGHTMEQRAATGAAAGAILGGPVGAAVGAGVGAVIDKIEGDQNDADDSVFQ
ncbi:MAG: hypothetical protein R3C52_11535 [Hyphomonadaceae bacterium]